MTRMTLHDNLETAWRHVLTEILDNGIETAPRGMKTKEVIHASFTLADANRNIVWNPERKLSHYYAVAEWLWIMLGRKDVATIAPFNKRIAQYSDDGETFFGAYGPWVVKQLPGVVAALKRDPDTRQAVMTIWQQNPPPTKDVPCTVALQFLLRAGRLHAQAFMRSNDAWLGLPYDCFTFTRIQAYVAALVGVPVGTYTHTVGSLHLYEADFEKARNAVSQACPCNVCTDEPVSPPLTVMPVTVPWLFERIALNDWPVAIDYLSDTPWRTYLNLLLHKRYKDPALLAAPYDRLVTS